MQTATFAAGCFWGVEEAFRTLDGVLETAVGYMGGTTENPTYRDVCSGTTGHAEVVQLQFDPERISYDELLHKLWEVHDPTTMNRQGPDVGSQYRSAIFFHAAEQRLLAEQSIQQLESQRSYRSPVVTQVVAAATFWRAEEYHQQYVLKKRSPCQH